MKRIFRAVWVLAANGCFAWLMFTQLQGSGIPGGKLNFQLWLRFAFVFGAILSIAGIVFEFVNRKFARWVNVGCFTAAGCFCLAATVRWRSDFFVSGFLLISALGLLAIAGLTEIIYVKTFNNQLKTWSLAVPLLLCLFSVLMVGGIIFLLSRAISQ